MSVVRAEIVWFVSLLALVIVYKLLTGGIVTDGLLSNADGTVSVTAVQLLFFTILGAGHYLLRVLETRASGVLPPVGTEILVLVSASQAIYSGTQGLPPFVRFLFGAYQERNRT
ncbi:MAG TPA: hypothetical protein VHK90_05590 [Thermoanaerobaculia bacterium]|nr:hypothetical protein [Thermoanaerobaculia bacterium]